LRFAANQSNNLDRKKLFMTAKINKQQKWIYMYILSMNVNQTPMSFWTELTNKHLSLGAIIHMCSTFPSRNYAIFETILNMNVVVVRTPACIIYGHASIIIICNNNTLCHNIRNMFYLPVSKNNKRQQWYYGRRRNDAFVI